MHIQPTYIEDRSEIISLVRGSIEGNYKDQNIETHIHQTSIAIYKAKELIGVCLINKDKRKNHVMIKFIAVRESYRSKGIGKMMINNLKENYDRINIKVREKNDEAISFYDKNGFLQWGFRKGHYGNGEGCVMLRWKKKAR